MRISPNRERRSTDLTIKRLKIERMETETMPPSSMEPGRDQKGPDLPEKGDWQGLTSKRMKIERKETERTSHFRVERLTGSHLPEKGDGEGLPAGAVLSSHVTLLYQAAILTYFSF